MVIEAVDTDVEIRREIKYELETSKDTLKYDYQLYL